MPYSKYETLVRIVDCGSITQAAKELGYTQSAVSHILSGLEEEFGFPLLTRSRSGIQLTSSGERILPAFRSLVASEEHLRQISAALKGMNAGKIRIGTISSIGVHFLPGILHSFLEKYPSMEFSIKNGDYHDVEQWITDDSSDICFTAIPASASCKSFPLCTDRLFAILSKNHRHAGLSVLPMDAVQEEPFIALPESSAHDLRHALANTGITPNIRFRTNDDYAIISMVEHGLGISIMPELLLLQHSDRVAVLELENHPFRTLGMVFPKISEGFPAVASFSQHAADWVSKNYTPRIV